MWSLVANCLGGVQTVYTLNLHLENLNISICTEKMSSPHRPSLKQHRQSWQAWAPAQISFLIALGDPPSKFIPGILVVMTDIFMMILTLKGFPLYILDLQKKLAG